MRSRFGEQTRARIFGLILVALATASLGLAAAPSFSGFVRLPVDLYADSGVHLEAGQYSVEVKQENGQYTLNFKQEHHALGSAKGVVLKDVADSDEFDTPLIGTQYLRSSDDPVGSEAERHFSKTGLPHYQEEGRDWKATLRAYTSPEKTHSLWLFEQRQPDGSWLHVEFTLSSNP